MVRYFIDTNILWWYFNKNSKHHIKVNKEMNDLIMKNDNSFYINEFVVIELCHLLIKRVKNGYEIAKRIINNEYPFFNVVFDIINQKALLDLIGELSQYGHTTSIGGRDSSIIVSMRIHKVKVIITNDGGFDNIEDMIVLNPIVN